ncbi:MAG: Maf family protein [Reinekea sp.]
MIRMQRLKSKAFYQEPDSACHFTDQTLPEPFTMSVILASQSSYKQSQLHSLGVSFEIVTPNLDEDHSTLLSPEALAVHLAKEKATTVQACHPEAIIIGSDQTAELNDGHLLTKPETRDNAIKQLQQSSGQTARFHSAVCVIHRQHISAWSVETQVKFRLLTAEEITRYVDADKPLDCAGSFKIESLGIALFDSVQSNDPSALVGLPLISLAEQLRQHGLTIP